MKRPLPRCVSVRNCYLPSAGCGHGIEASHDAPPDTPRRSDPHRFVRLPCSKGRALKGMVAMARRARQTSRGDDLTDSDDEMRVAMRQIVGVFSQLEKTRLVKKLKAARDRKKVSGKAVIPGANPTSGSDLRCCPGQASISRQSQGL
jgi:hypothetical protein